MILTSANNITNSVLSNTINAEERKVLPKEITGPGTIDSATDAVYQVVSYNYREGTINEVGKVIYHGLMVRTIRN